MTTESARARILDKLTKIKAHMESAKAIGSDHEAEAFAGMMQRLMDEHSIAMTDLEFEQHEAEEPVGEWRIDYAKHGETVGSRRNAMKEQLTSIIARAHHCRILLHRSSDRITLVGRKSDCEIAEYMIITLYRLVHKMALSQWWKEWRRLVNKEGWSNREARQHLLGFRVSYVRAFSARLAQRYREEREAVTGTSTALVRLNRADQAVQDFMGEHYGKAKSATALTGFNANHGLGWRRGTEAANALNLRGTALRSNHNPATRSIKE